MAHLEWIYPLKMVIFHSYVKLPEGSFAEMSDPTNLHSKAIFVILT